MRFTAFLGAALLAQQAVAHPGQSKEEAAKEMAERRAYLNANKRSLAHCADALKKRGNDIAMHQRRAAQVEKARAKRSIAAEKPYLRARDVESVLATDHKSNLTGITTDTDASILFAGNNSCILTPETTQGPYWVQGELVREDISDAEEGVPLTLDIQIIDVNTCEPVPQAYLEIWHCNSTGVYSGVVASGNGNSEDETNLDATFHRGLQQSNEDGVVTFETKFPGHYTGRATHIHVMTTLDATLNANETISGGSVTHVGQMFFDQSLISLVEAEEPYASNTQELTTNAEDTIFSEEAATVDPVIEYVLLGDSISDGIFGWLAFGMDSNAAYNITPAAYLTSEGGVENENSGMGGGPGGPPSGTGAPPTGAIPTGSVLATGAAPSSTLLTTVSSSSANVLAGEVTSSSSSSSSSSAAAASSNAPQRGDGGKAREGQASSSRPGRPGQQQQQRQRQQNGRSRV